MKTAQTCYLCQAPATTFDHIPPKSLFPKDFQYKGVKVPACKSCNNATSKDDEYLRDCFAMTGWNKEARQVFVENALKKIVKGLHFHRYKKSIPDNYTLKVYFQPTDIGLNLLDEAKKKGALNAGRFGNTFCYMGFNVREDEFVGIWWLSFYQTHAAILMVDSSNKLLG